jgi:cytidyltransferase-like protein
MVRRARTLAKHTFPTDWTPAEIRDWSEVWQRVRAARAQGQRIVFASGVFDLFHSEHQHFLERARAAGDYLVVGLESDWRVRQLKGPGRPVEAQAQRREKVLASGVVDDAAILPEQFDQPAHHRALIGLLQPTVLAVSSHSPRQEEKRRIVEEFGGRLAVVLEHNRAVSTTSALGQGTMKRPA